MAILFSEAWMKQFAKAWNSEKKMVVPLGNINFSSNIGYGFDGNDNPSGVLIVEKGKVVRSGTYSNEELNWYLRATQENWRIWIESGFGLSRLGPAVTMGKLKFVIGDYRKMIRSPSMSAPFLRHFVIMSEMKTSYK